MSSARCVAFPSPGVQRDLSREQASGFARRLSHAYDACRASSHLVLPTVSSLIIVKTHGAVSLAAWTLVGVHPAWLNPGGSVGVRDSLQGPRKMKTSSKRLMKGRGLPSRGAELYPTLRNIGASGSSAEISEERNKRGCLSHPARKRVTRVS